MLAPEHIQSMSLGFWQNDVPSKQRDAAAAAPWIPMATARDQFMANLVTDIHQAMLGESEPSAIPFKMYVTNTECTGQPGRHWITVGISIEPQ